MSNKYLQDPESNHVLHELVKTLRSYDNPDHAYIGWSPGGDYMSKEHGWNKNIVAETWKEFWHGKEISEDANVTERMEASGFKKNDWDLNLIADYHFEIVYDTENCDCYQGYAPQIEQIARTFYSDGLNEGWNDKITQDEVQALVDNGRLYDWTHTYKENGWQRREDGYIPTAEEVNAAQNKRYSKSHDAINCCILIEARAKRLGLLNDDGTSTCKRCQGKAYRRIGPDRLVLYLWLLHPRKGASRGVTIKNVQLEELPEVKEFLRYSMEQHKKHFAWAMEG